MIHHDGSSTWGCKTVSIDVQAQNDTAHKARFHILWSALGLLAFVLLLYAPILFTDRVLASGDILHYFYPYRDYAAEAFRQYRLPLWNPYIFNGVPFLANPQAAVFYPLHWPLSWLSVTKQIYWSAALHTWLLGCGGVLLMRRWGHSMLAALATGLILAGSGFYGGLLGHINQMNGAAWLPWLLLVTESVARPDETAPKNGYPWHAVLRGAALFGVITALTLLAGHTQTAYINLFGVGVWIVWPLVSTKLFTEPGRLIAQVLPGLGIYFGGVVLALLLAAIQLLPTLELSELGLRSGGLPYGEVSSFSLKPLHLYWTLLPSYGLTDLSVRFSTLGYTEFVAYVGLIGLVLAIYGLWQGRTTRDRTWTFGLLFVVLGFGLAMGRWNPVYYLLYKVVPGFDFFRAPARWMMLYTLGMAALAGLGVDLLRGKLEQRSTRDVRTAHPSILTRQSLLPIFLIIAIALELLIAARALPHTQPTAPQAVYDLRTAPAHLLADPARTVHPAAGGRFLSMSTTTFDPGDMADYQRILLDSQPPQLEPEAFEELILAQKSQEVLAPNLPMLWRVPAVDGFDGGVLPLERYIRYLTLFIDDEGLVPDGRLREQVQQVPDADLLGLLNVRYLITDKVRDLWYDGVYYDRQMGARLHSENLSSVTVDSPLPFEATHIDVIGYVEGSDGFDDKNRIVAQIDVLIADQVVDTVSLVAGDQPGAHFADGQLESAYAETAEAIVAYQDVEGGQQEYRARLALVEPQTPDKLVLTQVDNAHPIVIQAVTLYDQRTGMFEALLPSDRGQFDLVHSGDVKIYENRQVLPRAYLVSDWVPVENLDEAMSRLRDGSVDFRTQAVVEGAPQPDDQTTVASPGTVSMQTYSPERVEMQVEAAIPSLLVFSDSYYPGWQATLDGVVTPIYPTNGLFRGVLVPPGSHNVTFSYRSLMVQRGIWLSLVGLLLLVAVLLASHLTKDLPQHSGNEV